MTTPKTALISKNPLSRLSKSLLWGLLISILLLALFTKLSEDLLYNELGTFDRIVGELIRGFATPSLTSVAVVITNLGSAYIEIGLTVLVGGFLWFRLKHVWETSLLAISLSGAWLLNTILKDLFHRARPDIVHLANAGGYSFPSGHAMVSAAFYGVVGYLVWINLKNRSKPSWYVIVFTFALILAIGISRIYLGVHFASDVIAGYAAGGVWAIACIIGLKEIRYYKSKK
ncbi:MAG TPA: phosphatase PAP2 family protein [Desulfosporosinus sp.]|jgi:undecaprenyl-diphosphatase|nr:phosphatase PAP2 family protein [Desulfosporosinus sp.]